MTEKERFWHVREFIFWHYSKLVTVTVAVRIEAREKNEVGSLAVLLGGNSDRHGNNSNNSE